MNESKGLLPAQAQVVVTESRGYVDYAGAVVHGNEVGVKHLRVKELGRLHSRGPAHHGAFELSDFSTVRRGVVQLLIGKPHQGRSFVRRQHPMRLIYDSVNQLGGKH